MSNLQAGSNNRLSLEQVAGSVYAATINSQLVEEQRRKNSFEQRGISVVTTSGAIATLLFGFGAFVYGPSGTSLDATGVGFLVTALVLFVASAVAGLLTNQVQAYSGADIQKLRTRLPRKVWEDLDPVEAARRDAILNYRILARARKVNNRKASFLYLAFSLEVLAVTCVAASVTLVITRSCTKTGCTSSPAAVNGVIALSLLALTTLVGFSALFLSKDGSTLKGRAVTKAELPVEADVDMIDSPGDGDDARS